VRHRECTDGFGAAKVQIAGGRRKPVDVAFVKFWDAQAQSERRGDLSLTSWTNGGTGYLVIGRLPEQQIADLARTFERRFSKI
jgi:anti-sigma factor RsiW